MDGSSVGVSDVDPVASTDGASSSKMEQKEDEEEKLRRKKIDCNQFAHLNVFANDKAGMNGVDKDHVNRVIFEMTKNTPCFKNKAKMDVHRQKQIKDLQNKRERIREWELKPTKLKVDAIVEKLKSHKDFSQIYVVIDMDMFFAAVEMRDNPSLIGKPMAVGGMSMISTANYEARKFGVRSAMPGFVAKELCPQLIFVKGNHSKYKVVSDQIKKVFLEYDPDLTSMSLDEAYLNITNYINEKFDPEGTKSIQERMKFAYGVVEEIRKRVSEETRLTCSAGIAATKMIAKVCSDINKPNGQKMILAKEEEMERFVHDLPIRKVPGVGPATEKLLHDVLNIKTVRDLWDNRYLVSHLFTENFSTRFLNICILFSSGDPQAFQVHESKRKSIGHERTFGNEGNPTALIQICQDLCKLLAKDCKKKNILGKTLTLKLKHSDFQVFTRQEKFSVSFPKCEHGSDVFDKAKDLLMKELPCTLRLMGLKVSDLIEDENESPNTEAIGCRPIKELFDNSKKQQSEKRCPICDISLAGQSVEQVNTHIDDCLSSSASPPDPDDAQFETQVIEVVEEDHDDSNIHTNTIMCPICMKLLGKPSNEELNRHIDLCTGGDGKINTSTTKPTIEPPKPKKQRTILSFF